MKQSGWLNYIEDENSETGSGGQSGKVHFKYQDFAQSPPRDDCLPPADLKRLLVQHVELHQTLMKKQKEKRTQRENQKQNKFTQNFSLDQALGAGLPSKFKAHPLRNKAQFSGIEERLPSDLNVDTNQEMQDRLENRLENRLNLTNAPKFNPRPRPPGG